MIRLVKTFWESTIVDGVDFLIPTKSKIIRAKMLVQFFYLFVFFAVFRVMEGGVLQSPFNYMDFLALRDFFRPIWATKWMPVDHWEAAIRAFCAGFFAVSILTSLFWERFAFLRVLTAVFLFVYVGITLSFGRTSHEFYALMLVACMLALLPRQLNDERGAIGLMRVLFGVQTFLLATYASSGIWKYFGFFGQLFRGEISAFSPDAMARSATSNLLNHGSFNISFLYDFVVDHPSFLWSALLVGGYSIELFSMYVIFRPKLFKLWGVGLVMLHVGNVLIVGPTFPWQSMMVLLFIVFGPHSAGFPSVIQEARDGLVKLQQLGKAQDLPVVIYYDGHCLMCNGFLKYLSRFELPETWVISTIQGSRYQQLLTQNEDLKRLDSIVVTTRQQDGTERIRVKASGVVWALTQVHTAFWGLRILRGLSPLVSNIVYDLVAKNRTRVTPDLCPIPPASIRERLDRQEA